MTKIFVGLSKEDVQDQIAKWVSGDPSILILRKTFAITNAGEPGGSPQWEAIVEYESVVS